MPAKAPRVSIGLPVFNGELYLSEAMDSLLKQTFEDFELIVSDNASTDRTEAIVREYAARDSRVRYSRNEINLGGCFNQNRIIQLSSGRYFLLAHHDDVRAPEYLERCVTVLDREPAVVLCYSRTLDIDEAGQRLPRVEVRLSVDARRPSTRFRDLIRLDHLCEPIFGLVRIDSLRRTVLHGNYADSDRPLLADLSLHGPFHQVPDVLFFRRAHPLQSTAVYNNRQVRAAWFDPSMAGRISFPHFRELMELVGVVARAPIERREKVACYLHLARWTLTYRRRLLSDLEFAAREVLRPLRDFLLHRAVAR